MRGGQKRQACMAGSRLFLVCKEDRGTTAEIWGGGCLDDILCRFCRDDDSL